MDQSTSTDCWACDLARGDPAQHKTQWHTLDNFGIVVTDLNPRGYDKRLLWVPVWHVTCGRESKVMIQEALERLGQVVDAVCQNEGLSLITWEIDKHSYEEHWHAQACLDRKEADD
jgi:hypothetical protein